MKEPDSVGKTMNVCRKFKEREEPCQDMRTGFQASQKYLGRLSNPPAISLLIVSGLANPDFLVEIEATAFVPESTR